MAQDLDSIVQILISRGSTPIATASFEIPMILTQHTAFAQRARVYNNLTSVAADFGTASNTYLMASKVFGQSTVGAVPPSVVIGRRQVDSVTGSVTTLSDNTVYSVIINGITYSVTSGEDATASQIATALDTAVGTLAGINFVVDGDTFTVSVATPGTGWSVRTSSNLTLTQSAPTESWVDAMERVIEVNDTWYALIAETHVQADVLALANAIQARRKIFGTSTSDSNFESGTHIGQQLSDDGLGRTFWIYTAEADQDYPEAAWIGAQLPYTPGSNDWAFKRLAGVTVSNVTDNARNLINGLNGNYYTTIAGVNVMQTGDMADGLPIDETILVDWIYARLQEAIFFRLINTLKIPLTNPGLAIIENEIRTVLARAEENNGIDVGWRVIVPDVLDIPETMRAQRTAGTFQFQARLAGSIRRVLINGFLSI